MQGISSEFLKLSKNDIVKGVVTAVFTALVVALGGIVTQPNFDVFTVDWGTVGHLALNASVAAFVAYLSKNLLTNSQGQILGGIGGR